MTTYPFYQVDVFGDGSLSGNPLAVVLDAQDMDACTMQRVAAWLGLSETAFVMASMDDAEAGYAVRIFTQRRELPFAGHPTLGACAAWVAHHAIQAANPMVQRCAAGPVDVRPLPQGYAFRAPPLRRTGAMDGDTRAQAARALRLGVADLLDTQWIDNGSGWCAVLLRDVETVLSLKPDFGAMGRLKIGVAALCTTDTADGDIEVRAFAPSEGVPEDAVTGNLQAGLAWWLTHTGRMPSTYLARQGTVLNRRGRVHVHADAAAIWIGGRTDVRIAGTLTL
ncbi:PhzF family phenazine biosynthesis protein [Candidimonas nitroreducens]|uniref:Phenazine biosynthesis protein PhzF n=1 Tax=Candidimonas nitroreducens TaxID=683354 RepID=A0A225MLP5_9BURK|nr:PhzF family phenazine biosynthesis protein [Candidimonas nitroreducens]OWT62138.1 phenazine biosynthesis protein PhzF [Candidimonas nitroreducens]